MVRDEIIHLSSFEIAPRLECGADGLRSKIWFSVLADGSPILDFSNGGYAIDLNEWEFTRTYGGSYFIITCTCGSPGCTGIEKPIQVERCSEYVEWRMFEPQTKTFRFKKTDYANSFDDLPAIVVDLVDSYSTERIEFVPYFNSEFFHDHPITSHLWSF